MQGSDLVKRVAAGGWLFPMPGQALTVQRDDDARVPPPEDDLLAAMGL